MYFPSRETHQLAEGGFWPNRPKRRDLYAAQRFPQLLDLTRLKRKMRNKLLLSCLALSWLPMRIAQAQPLPSQVQQPQVQQPTPPPAEQAVAEPAHFELERSALREEMKELHESLKATQALLSAAQERETEREQEAAQQQEAERRKQAEQASKPPPPTPLKRGNFYLGGTFGATYKGRNNDATLLGTVDDGARVDVSTSARFGRIFRDNNLGLGLELKYDHTTKKGSLDSAVTGTVQDTRSTEYDLAVGPAVRQFLSLDANRRFFIYYQAALLFGHTEKVSRSFSDNSSAVLSANGYSVSLDVQPGIMIAASKNFAIEAGLNLLGVEYKHYASSKDYGAKGRQDDFSFNADVNLLSLQFAFIGYF
jgi:hypothetical protein